MRQSAVVGPLTIPFSVRPLLAAGDFTYLGWLDIVDGSTAAGYGAGLTLRRVGGQARLGMCSFNSGTSAPFKEWVVPTGLNVQLTPVLPQPGDIWNGATPNLSGAKTGLWFDADGTTLWCSLAIDYPNLGAGEGNYTSALTCRSVAGGGTVSNWQGWWGLSGVGQRSIYGGLRHVPQWFQAQNGVGPYLAGFGGYTSLMGQGLTPSLGPLFAFHADPRGYPTEAFTRQNGGTIPYRIGADFRSGVSGVDWYAGAFASRPRDRGSRVSAVTNWFDGNDSRGNPQSRPSYPSSLAATPHWWTGPAGGQAPGDPYGYGRWTWGDTYDGCCEWVDDDAGLRHRHGIVCVLSCRSGYVWYQTSDLYADAPAYEIHVYDPADVAAVLSGTLAPYKVQPRAALDITSLLQGAKTGQVSGSGQGAFHAVGSCFDPLTNRLYVGVANAPNGVNQSKRRVYIFQVAGS